MTKRMYICPVIGDGTEDNPFRPAIADLTPPVNWTATIPTGDDGRPLMAWCLAIVGTRNHQRVRAVRNIDPLPDFPLDGRVSAIDLVSRNAMSAALTRRGLNASAIVDGRDGFREVVRAIGRVNNPQFSELNFDCDDD